MFIVHKNIYGSMPGSFSSHESSTIHESAVIGPNVYIGPGCKIGEGSVVFMQTHHWS